MTSKRKDSGAGGDLLAIVRNAPRPMLAQRGQLLSVDDIVELFHGMKTRHWVNHSFLPSKKVKVGRSNAWWECDVIAAIDNGDLSA